MNLTTKIQLEEVIWLLATLPGLIYWVINSHTAWKTMAAVIELHVDNGRRMWAQFSFQLTLVFSFIEIIFMLIGVNSLFHIPGATGHAHISHWVTVISAIVATSLLTWLGGRWRRVDESLLASARRRDAELNRSEGA